VRSGLSALEAAIDGSVIVPGSPDYEERKPAWARFHHIRPEAVVVCATPADVPETIAFARHAGLDIAPRGAAGTVSSDARLREGS
jgi:hypothetical protein